MWKKLSQKVILQHPRLTVLEDQVELPNGHQTDYIHFQQDYESACIICENEQGQILVQEEYCYPLDKVIIQLPGGAVPLNERPIDGAVRELKEESGIKAHDLVLLGEYYLNNRRTPEKQHVFYATKFTQEKIPHDIEEDIKNYWIDKNTLEEKIKSGEIQNVHLIASWGLYKLKRQKLP
jgi:ADP-ribose pyrophosphatase